MWGANPAILQCEYGFIERPLSEINFLISLAWAKGGIDVGDPMLKIEKSESFGFSWKKTHTVELCFFFQSFKSAYCDISALEHAHALKIRLRRCHFWRSTKRPKKLKISQIFNNLGIKTEPNQCVKKNYVIQITSLLWHFNVLFLWIFWASLNSRIIKRGNECFMM